MAGVLEIIDLAVGRKIHGWTFVIIDGNSWKVDFFQYPLRRHQ